MLQVRSAHPPMPHRTSSSSCSGVPVGLFSDSAPTHLRCAGVPLGLFGKPKRSSFSRVRGLHQAIPLLQNARPPAAPLTLRWAGGASLSPCSAPECFFKTSRCSGRLFFHKEYAVLFAPKRSTSSRFAASGGRGELRSPLSPHRNVFSKHPGVPHGLFYDQAILWLDLQNAHASGSLRSPFGGREELRSPLHPPLPPPLFIGRFAAFDRQIPKEVVFIPPNAAFAQLSLAHSAAFCYAFLNNRTRCGKRRLLP